MQSLQLVKQLYQPGDPRSITQIQAHLQELQRGPEGWQMAGALLMSKDTNCRFFGALTFTVKLNNDNSAELDSGQVRDMLEGWLVSYKKFVVVYVLYVGSSLTSLQVKAVSGQDQPLVIRKLCSTLAQYYLKPNVTSPGQLLQLLARRMGDIQDDSAQTRPTSSGEPLTTNPMSRLNAHQVCALLWFCTAFAEQASTTLTDETLQ